MKKQHKVCINYKSGKSHEFWAWEFNVKHGTYTWESVSDIKPFLLGADNIESIFIVDTRWRFKIGV